MVEGRVGLSGECIWGGWVVGIVLEGVNEYFRYGVFVDILVK